MEAFGVSARLVQDHWAFVRIGPVALALLAVPPVWGFEPLSASALGIGIVHIRWIFVARMGEVPDLAT